MGGRNAFKLVAEDGVHDGLFRWKGYWRSGRRATFAAVGTGEYGGCEYIAFMQRSTMWRQNEWKWAKLGDRAFDSHTVVREVKLRLA